MVTLANVQGSDFVVDPTQAVQSISQGVGDVLVNRAEQQVFSEFSSPAQKREAFLRISKINPQFGKVVLDLLERQETLKLKQVQKEVDDQARFAVLLKKQSKPDARKKLLMDKANEAVVEGEDPSELLRMAEMDDDQLTNLLDESIISATDMKTLTRPNAQVEEIGGVQFIRQPDGTLKEVSRQRAPQQQAQIETIEGRQFIRGADGSLKAVPLPREPEVKPFSPSRFEQEKELGKLGVLNDISKAIAVETAKQNITATSDVGQLKKQILEGKVADRNIAIEKRQMRRDAADSKALRLEGKIQEAKDLIGKAGWFTTGLLGSIVRRIPGTPATDLRATLQTIKAVIGFETLQAMRDASPTGGALGQTSDREIQLLTSTIASLDQDQSDEFLRKGLNQIMVHIQNWKKIIEDPEPEIDPQPALAGARREAERRVSPRFTIREIR